ncbi:MAG: DHH family phosphoesterase [Chloroflexi bacterium]|nr:DHH family phosphoesterase [Chloroflexota bacterium]
MTRPNARNLIEIARNYPRIAVVSHDNPDPDSMASAFGLHELLERTTKSEVDICFTGVVGKVGNLAMLKIPRVRVRWVDGADLKGYDGIIFVDSQPGGGNYSLAAEAPTIAVLDHHPPTPELKRVPFLDVRTDLGATSTIVTEYLFDAEVNVDARLATCLVYGIKSETLDLSRRTTSADIQAYMRLFPLVDFELLGLIQNPKLPRIYFEHIRRAMERAYSYDGVVISDIGRDARPEVVAEAADLLLRLQDIHWSVCFGEADGEFFISVRTSNPGSNAGDLVQKAVAGLGSAGGHDSMAAARIRPAPVTDEGLEDLKSQLTRRFLSELGVTHAVPCKLLEWKERKAETDAA